MHHYFVEGFVLPNQNQIWWTILIVLYPYITGIVAGAFIISSLYHVFNKEDLKPVSRFSLLMAFAFLLFATCPLLGHLGRPERALNIMLTPNPTSAMAGFGFIYATYLIILAIEIWLVYRPDIVYLSKHSSSMLLRKLYWLLSLGVDNVSKSSLESDHKVMIFLASIGIPAACTLHGYVGFIFGAIKANPWWSSPMMPVIFLLSAIVSGIAMVLVCYQAIHYLKGRAIDSQCTQALMGYLWLFAIIDVAIELLEIINHAYMANEDWEVLHELVMTKLFVSYVVIQMLVCSVIPIGLLGAAIIFRKRLSDRIRNAMGFLSAMLLLIQVLAMRWNVVIGGQMFSKSFRGFLRFDVEVFGREGLLVAFAIFLMPFITLGIFARLLPLWGPIETYPKKWLRKGLPEKQNLTFPEPAHPS
ncbi:MAG: polysulfide reductase NrfD [Deltaproteobacteria bacterium]|nr:polysulfide reductase NrfD [Deltaproteobacteria bacterium]